MVNEEIELTNEDLKLMLKGLVSSGNCEETQRFFDQYSDRINTSAYFGESDEEGILFGFALTQSPKLLKIVIDNYVKLIIKKHYYTLTEYEAERQKLSDMLQTQLTNTEFCNKCFAPKVVAKFKRLLKPWLPEDYYEDEEDSGYIPFYDLPPCEQGLPPCEQGLPLCEQGLPLCEQDLEGFVVPPLNDQDEVGDTGDIFSDTGDIFSDASDIFSDAFDIFSDASDIFSYTE